MTLTKDALSIDAIMGQIMWADYVDVTNAIGQFTVHLPITARQIPSKGLYLPGSKKDAGHKDDER